MQIVKVPKAVLNAPVQTVTAVDKKLLDFIEEMKKTLVATDNPRGVGLAAPQVGHSLRIFITKPWPRSPFTIFINPEIVWRSEEKTEDGVPQRKNKYEGCLSIPDIWGVVHRAKKIKVKSYQITMNRHLITKERLFSGFLATIIQHEIDHLNGILFTQRVLEQREKLFKLVKDEKGEDTFEPLEI